MLPELNLLISLLSSDTLWDKIKPIISLRSVICIFHSCGRNGEIPFPNNVFDILVSQQVVSFPAYEQRFFAGQKQKLNSVMWF